MHVVFRVDASVMIGSGHVMRCLTLADRLRLNGAQVRFVCRHLRGDMLQFIRDRGFEAAALPARTDNLATNDVPIAEWLDPEWASDANQTAAILAEARCHINWVIVDSYALDARWETKMRATGAQVMVIDDLANRPHDSDVLLDQNFHPDVHSQYDALIPVNCRRLLGPRYALLRPEFKKRRLRTCQHDGRIQRILVSFGGTDPGNETGKALHAIESLQRDSVATDVIAGAGNPHFEALSALCSRLPQTKLYRQVPNMAEFMGRADLAIGAPGSTTWERCCLALPTILISLAINQKSVARALAKDNYAIHLGGSQSVTVNAIKTALQKLFDDPSCVSLLSRACAELVDGRGTERVARALDARPISLRLARAGDADNIYKWRNAEETRRHSHQTAAIPQEEHQQWFKHMLSDSARILLIGERNGQPIGVLRFDCEGSGCTISVYLVPGQYRHGYGSRLLCAGYEWLKSNRPNLKSIHAKVSPQNHASVNAFLQAGYQHDGDAYIKNLI